MDGLTEAVAEVVGVEVAVEEELAVVVDVGDELPVLDYDDVCVNDGVRLRLGTMRVRGRQGSATPPETRAAGTAVCPLTLLPQQAIPPAVDRAHVWYSPAATAT